MQPFKDTCSAGTVTKLDT